ncbi:glycine-rich domain-containing protein [Chryseobacterium sp. PMSZPI]|uniref:glycine-rich domain-containing protein n=1 Tax=Chryseobacterium sp. PMSZPI TaxID=1033900 RepID=UPI000C32FEAE|nr:hypothetical protein [Chryseobacterium sp. PMSZPI]PKF75182.1 hypothetical protein CW752_05555 [Chryseobacterium sp. PMSZPI]
METKMFIKDESLWKRIQEYSLDDPDVDFPFSKKLAKEENWNLDFTKRAIEEYKKFVYLCCILPKGASPSQIVDKVWHLHLIYTQSYWEDFCPNILRRPLHHHPSKGGKNENTKHQNWFLDTLKSYKEVFQCEIPRDIWLQKESISSKNNWWKKLRIVSLFAILLLLSSCLGEIISGLTSVFFSLLAAFIFGGLLGLFQNNNTKNKGDSDSSCGGSSCSSGGSCGGGCGGGCGGCGGCGG